MKNGGKNKSVAFIILFSVYIYIYIELYTYIVLFILSLTYFSTSSYIK